MSNILGPQTGYVDLFMYELDEDIAKAARENKTFQRTPIRPSSAGKCARELYFELQQYSGRATFDLKPWSAETDLLLNLGHHIERHILEKLKRHFTLADVRFQQQILDFGYIEAVNDKRLSQHLEGSMDLCFWSDKWKCIADVKSKGDNYNFRARKMKWEEDTEKLSLMSSVKQLSDRAFWVDDLPSFLNELQDPFFESNFVQLNMYANSDFIKSRNIDHAAIIQYHKAKSKLREIRFRPSQKVFDATVDKLRNVVRAVDEDLIDLAPAEYGAGSFKSRYCSFCAAKVPGSCAMVNKVKGTEE